MDERSLPSWLVTSWTFSQPGWCDAWDVSGSQRRATGAVTGLGIDLERVARFADHALGRSPAFLSRVFGGRERSAWHGDPAAAALCFTAKEAIAKALGTGLSLKRGPVVPCQDIEVLVDLAAPSIAVDLHGAAAVRAASAGARGALTRCWCDATIACSVAVLHSGALDERSADARLAGALRDLSGRLRDRSSFRRGATWPADRG